MMSEPTRPQSVGQELKKRKVSSSSSVVSSSSPSGCLCGSHCNCAASNERTTTPKFACPYYQRHPNQRPSSTSCAYPGFPTIFRVKEHLYKKHRALDTKCPRCLETFDTEDALQDHQRARDACELQQARQPSGFSKDQERQLRSRKRSPGCMSEEEKWLEVYRILFPQDTDKPTPYVEGGRASVLDFRRYRDFSRRVFRHVLMRELGFFDWSHHASFDQMNNTDIVDVVMKCQEQVFQKFVEDNPAGTGVQTPGTSRKDTTKISVKPPPSCIPTDRNDLETDTESWTLDFQYEALSPQSVDEEYTILNDMIKVNLDSPSEMVTSPLADVLGVNAEAIGEDGFLGGLNFDSNFSFTFDGAKTG